VPAAAVIPAPGAYTKVVVVKKLVVECDVGVVFVVVRGREVVRIRPCPYFLGLGCSARGTRPLHYCEQIEAFQAGSRREHSSME
jgi:hypothetical protein